MKIFGVIMAGGGGTRFWPLSRKQTPKQLLNLSGNDVMINEAFDRLANVVDNGNIFVVTNDDQAEKVLEVTGGRLEPSHVLKEPAARDTAACIGYAAFEIIKKYGDGVMVITPSDAFIKDEVEFARVLNVAVKEAEKNDSLVTVGIRPTFPATGYGYINVAASECEIKDVKRFVEKPNLLTARKYLKSGSYLWNSGMFVWKASVILKQFKKLLPDVYSGLEKIADKFGTDKERATIEKIYPDIRRISVDYGIMEKAEGIKAVVGDFGWNDVGSWDMLGALHEADAEGNVSLGETICLDSKNNVIYTAGKPVVLVGVSDTVVVETPDVLMVCPKQRVQEIKKVVEKLREDNKDELL